MTSTAPDGRTREDRCPGVLTLHEAADGWLARVRVPGGRLSVGALEALAGCAEQLGSGLVDLTARANVQLRGLRPDAGAHLRERLGPAGLLPSPAHDRSRNVLASPLAGRAPGALDGVDELVDLLDDRLVASAALRDLPARFCFLVDDGSGAGRELRPDVTISARGNGRFAVALDGRALRFDGDGPAAVAVAVRAAEAFVAAGGDAWRLSEAPGGAESVAAALDLALAPLARVGPTPAFGPGEQRQRDGRVALTAAAPLGQLVPASLRALAGAGTDAGVRLSTRRTATLVDLAPDAVGRARASLAAAGLVLDAGSGWTGLTACAGTDGCSRALADVRAAAAARARVRHPRAPAEHWSACERRCGELPGTPVAVTARAPGEVELRSDGRARQVRSLDRAARLLAAGAGP